MSKDTNIIHPLLNVELPEIDDWYRHCVDDEAKSIIKSACQLAAYRCLCAQNIQDKIAEYQAFPFDEKIELDINAETELVRPIDLVRALIATHSENLQNCLFDSHNNYSKPSERFFESSRYWMNILQETDPETEIEQLDPIWARRWALGFLENSELPVSRETLVSSVLDVIPAEWFQMYQDGLATRGETFNGFTNNFHDYIRSTREKPLTLRSWLPEAFYDRSGLFKKITDTWQENSVLFLVFADDFSKQHFLDYLKVSRAMPNLFPLNMRRHLVLNPFVLDSNGFAGSLTASNDEYVHVYGGNLSINHNERGWVFDAENEIVGGAAKLALSFFNKLIKSENKNKILMGFNQHEFNQLAKELPDVINLSRFSIPKLNSRDLIPLLIAQYPKLQLKMDFELKSGEFLNALLKLTEKYQDDLPEDLFSFFEEIIHQVKSDRAVGKACNLSDAEPFSFMNHQRSARATKRRISKMLKSDFSFFIKYIGDIEKLQAISVLFDAVKYLRTDVKQKNQYDISDEDYLFLSEKQSQIKAFPLFDKKSTRSLSEEDLRLFLEDTPSWKGELSFLERLSSPVDIFKKNIYSQSDINQQKAYINQTKQLTESSIEQATRHAIHISSDHSWYKKLSLLPNEALYVFLNPQAVIPSAVKQINEISPEKYKERYGYWQYRITSDYDYAVPNLVLRPEGYENINKFIVYGPDKNLIIPPDLLELGRCNVSAFLSSDVVAIDIWYEKREALLKKGYKKIIEYENQLPKSLSPTLRFLSALINQDFFNPDEKLGIDNPVYSELLEKNYTSPEFENHKIALEAALKLGGREHYRNIRLAIEYKKYIEDCKNAVVREQVSYLQFNLIPDNFVEAELLKMDKTWRDEEELIHSIYDAVVKIRNQLLSVPSMNEGLTTITLTDEQWNALITDELISQIQGQKIESHQRKILRALKSEVNKNHDISSAILTGFEFSPAIVLLIRQLSRIHIQQLECIIDSAMKFQQAIRDYQRS